MFACEVEGQHKNTLSLWIQAICTCWQLLKWNIHRAQWLVWAELCYCQGQQFSHLMTTHHERRMTHDVLHDGFPLRRIVLLVFWTHERWQKETPPCPTHTHQLWFHPINKTPLIKVKKKSDPSLSYLCKTGTNAVTQNSYNRKKQFLNYIFFISVSKCLQSFGFFFTKNTKACT